MSETCYQCGKRYKSIARGEWVHDRYTGQFSHEPVCRRCWAGIILVDLDTDLVCDDCRDTDCPVSVALVEDWQESIEAKIKEDYPRANVMFLNPCDQGEEEAAHWDPCGYIRCPLRYYLDYDPSVSVDLECPNKVKVEEDR